MIRQVRADAPDTCRWSADMFRYAQVDQIRADSPNTRRYVRYVQICTDMLRYAEARPRTTWKMRLLLAAPGCSWLLLAAQAASGCSWLLLAAPGCSWLLPPGVQIKPREYANQALEVQIKPQGSKSSPGGPNQAPGGPNQALGHKTGLQGCRPIKNTILDGSLEQDPNQAPGVQIKPRESKSSPGGPNRAPGVQIKPWRSKSSPWRSKSSPGSQNGSSRLQADKKHHSGRVPGAGEILGNLGRYARYVQMCTDMLLKYVQVRTDTPDTYSYAQKRADTPDTCRHALICSDTQRYARCAQIRQIRTDMLDTCRYVMIRQVRADAPDTCR